MRTLPYCFLIVVGGLCLATFLTSETLAQEQAKPACTIEMTDEAT